jgi:3-hydroxybutyryl-CoA dehydrogenase
MGCFNSLKAAISGYDVVLYDIDELILAQVAYRHQESAAFLVSSGYCAAADIPSALLRVSLVADLAEATLNADLVSESVSERLDVKREVHRTLDQVCPPSTILTSNTSFLCLSDFEDVVERGDRIAALHSYMASPLIDIVGGVRTSAATLDILKRYALSMNTVPLVLKKEYPGYILNAMLGPVLSTSMYLIVAENATCTEVDRAWMRAHSAPMGPLGILDLIGISLVYDSWLDREDEGLIPGLRPQVLELLLPYVERDELGMRSGCGFYRYPDPVYQQSNFLEAERERDDLYKPLQLALLGSALVVAASEVAEPAVIDQAWRVGMALQAGPFEILEKMGVVEFRQAFSEHVGSSRFDSESARSALDYLDQYEANTQHARRAEIPR